MSAQVAAQVVLRSADLPVTSENVDEVSVDEGTIERVTAELRRLGLTVGPTGPTSISITATPTLFEQVFSTRLEQRQAASGIVEFVAPVPIRIPDSLAKLVEGVVLPQSPELLP